MSTDIQELKRKRRLSGIILVVLLVVVLLSISVVLYTYVRDGELNRSLLLSVLACVAVSFPMLMGRKKITQEIESLEK